MENVYCWRAKDILPMLDEDEWKIIEPFLENTVRRIKEYRGKNNCDILTARLNCSPEVISKFEELSGFKNIPYDLIFQLRRSNYGPDCEFCDKILRTPKAKICAECGKEKSYGT